MSKETKDFEHATKLMSCQLIIDNFHFQLDDLRLNMGSFIENRLKNYLKTDLSTTEEDYVYHGISLLNLAIKSFINEHQKEKSLKSSLSLLNTKLMYLLNNWIVIDKRIDKTSLLVREIEYVKRKNFFDYDAELEDRVKFIKHQKGLIIENTKNPSTN